MLRVPLLALLSLLGIYALVRAFDAPPPGVQGTERLDASAEVRPGPALRQSREAPLTADAHVTDPKLSPAEFLTAPMELSPLSRSLRGSDLLALLQDRTVLRFRSAGDREALATTTFYFDEAADERVRVGADLQSLLEEHGFELSEADGAGWILGRPAVEHPPER